ncbi:acetyl-CoA carboxylase biotin carboxylase subunit [Bordetella sp. N]|uniref:acetyl/propionyl/methylcrotonyl-CoA carboxylase subunit alpha n=1 Tax=Bordetella sp. N TaxID=1746199 RepID=UPI0007101F58|nr:acetyl-CoA carboxylase biotin carboxylase subunit [Bordetella sp. N]ALM84287.1 3-methylcrotonyl-CoA carboxylase [Bordetella sp. N]
MTEHSPIQKVLVANRGEIALRIMRTARCLGIATVAVYSRADKDAAHVQAADQSVCIGEPAPAASYLNIPAIIDAARRCGADAIHPGYGFLAENATFAAACTDAGLIFIGPSPKAILDMGDKANAKRLMRAAGVPCVPGYEGEDQSAAALRTQADRIGYPVMIKATAGGGGRGMRIVFERQDFAEALHAAQSEAQSAFGSAAVIIEKAVQQPRHIEIQVLADRYGHAIHLGERDCSIQRRHQKVIEEAPGFGISAETRQSMGQAAVAAAKAIGYEGVGTLEFLLDDSGAFYFMEMNTRLQVEHPVTEAITGLDLVALQFNIAMGQPLALRQEDIRLQGHAIEVRLCAEDGERDFMPQSGSVALWRAPADIRVETGIRTGAEISPYYDSMFAKLVVHAEDRDAAIRRMRAALRETVALGVRTNLEFLGRCLAHPAYVTGGADTGFIARHYADLTAADPARLRQDMAVAAALLSKGGGATGRGSSRPVVTRRLPALLALRERDDAAAVDIRVLREGNTWKVTLGAAEAPADRATAAVDEIHEVTILEATSGNVTYTLNGVSARAAFVRDGDVLHLHRDGVSRRFEDVSLQARSGGADDAASGELRAATSSRVIEVRTLEGERVARGDVVAITEAMKMQTQHIAPFDGVVQRVLVSAGDQANARSLLVVLDRLPQSEQAPA